MDIEVERREVLQLLTALGPGSQAGVGVAAAHDHDHATLNRFATSATGAEITGSFATDDGRLFFDGQDPEHETVEPYDRAAIGGVSGVSLLDLPSDFPSVTAPETEREQRQVRVAAGEYQILARNGDETDDGKPFGVPTLPDGRPVSAVPGSEQTPFGTRPDCNACVPVGPTDPAGNPTAGDDRRL
jgi:hypothetical protein